MQENNIPSIFPQPSKRYVGPILDPLLIEEDYYETVGIVRRFARHNHDFTEDSILAHLAANGVSIYGTQEDWDGLFSEIREQIVYEGADKKPPVEISWAVHHLGDKALYTMVENTMAGSDEQPQISAMNSTPTAVPELIGQGNAIPQEIRGLLRIADKAILRNPDSMVRRSELTTIVASRLDLPRTEASVLLKQALTTGLLSKVSSQGVSFITLPSGEQTVAPARRDKEFEQGHQLDAERLADLEKYMQVVEYVMKSLVALRDVSMGQSYDKLWKRCGLQEIMGFDVFKGYVRRMEGGELVKIVKDAKLSTKTARSKILRGSKVYVANARTRSSWKVNAKENLNKMYAMALEDLIDEHP